MSFSYPKTSCLKYILASSTLLLGCQPGGETPSNPPNILFAISDDQSYPHTSAYGADFVDTPAFDRIAENGILFNNAFAAAPQCSPSRAAILTGRNIWQLEEAGTHGSMFPSKFPVFTDVLEQNGYFIGYTGKPWAPGNWRDSGWERNPAGPEFNMHFFDDVPYSGLSDRDYASNFKTFLNERPKGEPFFFWFGAHEPHRRYEYGSGVLEGKDPDALDVPPFLADRDIVRNDVLDYAVEIEWFDAQLGKMLAYLESIGELDNTVVVVTSDNGMPFPYAKANLQELGTHVPLAISGPGVMHGGRIVDDLTSLIDMAPTFLDLAGANHFDGITGRSLLPVFKSDQQGFVDLKREYVLTGRERHTHARPDNVGYPSRALRTQEFLYVKNFKPDRWPAGNPPPEVRLPLPERNYKEIVHGYEDIDDSPTKELMIKEKEQWPELFRIGFEKRPEAQLYDISSDPWTINDLSGDPDYAGKLAEMDRQLMKLLEQQKDPRVLGKGDIFESYPRFGLMRLFPGFSERGSYNPAFMDTEAFDQVFIERSSIDTDY